MTAHLNAEARMQQNATTQAQNPPSTRSPANNEDLQQAARELREAIRSNVQQQLSAARDAQVAAQAAQGARGAEGVPVPPTAPTGPRFTIRRPDGETVVSVDPNPFRETIPPEAVDISVAFFLTVAAVIIGLPLARAFARRMDRRTSGAQVPTEVASQLAQLNQAVDAIALEVERISEGQRFTTRILSEQRDARLPSAAER